MEGKKIAFDLTLLFRILVFPGFAFLFFLTMFCDWFERKVEARIENRMGPTYTGPAGMLQPLADFIKLLTKGEAVPARTRGFVYALTPLFAFSLFVFTMFLLPLDGDYVVPASGFEGDLILVLVLVSIANFAVFLAGWSSSNPLSEIGAVRILTQLLSYDVPIVLLALSPAVLASSLSMATIAAKQKVPFALLVPWVFFLFLFCIQTELEKDPFDIPHAETEIVAGYETEFSGAKLAFLKLSKDVQVVLGAALVVVLFLGGPYGPVLCAPASLWFALWFVLKTLVVILLSEMISGVFARLRIDLVLNIGWKMLLPTSVIMFIVTVWLLHLGLGGISA